MEPEPVGGGITNANFRVDDGRGRFFVRIGEDLPVHGILRFNAAAASRAAHAAGLSPEVVHQEPGALVLRFVEGRTLQAEDVREPQTLQRVLDLVIRCHRDVPRHLRGPTLAFWVFQVVRDYARVLRERGSRLAPELPRLMAAAEQLESAVGPVDLVFGHNDLLAANFIDAGDRLWLVDWDYAGWGSPLFDLGGLASNNELSSTQEGWLLERYFEGTKDPLPRRGYRAMKCASLLRESMWSAVSELHSTLDFDYVSYTTRNLARFERAFDELQRQ
ncbi:MAG: phosphotransferase [Myxococcota bacterium]